MRFTEDIISYRVAGVPMIGNTKTGFTIGLTSIADALCNRMFTEDVPEEEIREIDEALLFQLKENLLGASGKNVRVKTGYLHVTHACNMQCKGCYSYISNRNRAPEPCFAELCASLDLLARAKVDRLVISGGEPFLRGDLLDLAKFAKNESGFSNVTILTNGSLLREDAIKALAPYISCVSVSIDGFSVKAPSFARTEQVFDTVLRAFDLLKAAELESHLVVTIHAKNFRDLSRYKQLARSLGTTVSFSLLSPSSTNAVPDNLQLSAADMKELAELILEYQFEDGDLCFADTPFVPAINTRLGCGAGCSLLSVSANGELFPCYMLHSEKFGLTEACLESTKRYFPTVDDLECCSGCEYRYLCGGGCRARAFNSRGDIYARDPLCDLFKAYYEGLLSVLTASKERG